jgi:hypothetical protein
MLMPCAGGTVVELLAVFKRDNMVVIIVHHVVPCVVHVSE